MTGLTIRTAVMGGGLVCIALEGVLDGRTSELLEREVHELLERGSNRLAFDLERLGVLTSAGAGVFVGAVVMAQEHGGALALVRPAPPVRHVLDVLGLGDVFPFADTLDAAAACMETICAADAPPVAETA